MSPPDRTIPQVCVVPFRHTFGGWEFCLITSLSKGHWIFPKGIIDPGETYVEAALKESCEEAGLYGRIVGPPLGQYQDAKWGAALQVSVVLMEVTRCAERWAEADQRQRRWASAEESLRLLYRREHQRFLREACQRLLAGGPASSPREGSEA
jgi:8-oxo-dGTP pyrophosphatase MutT (NUDIX family)